MKRKNLGLISIVLVLALGLGTLLTVPAVFAETKIGGEGKTFATPCTAAKTGHTTQAVAVKRLATAKQPAPAKRIFTAEDKANLLTLKDLYKQIGATTKLIRNKVKADKKAGTALTAFTADLKLPQAAKTHRTVSHGLMFTEAERTALATMQTDLRTLELQLKTQQEARAPQATLDAIKVQIQTAITARTAYLKTVHTTAKTDYSSRLVTLIADANAKLAFLQGLLARLP